MNHEFQGCKKAETGLSTFAHPVLESLEWRYATQKFDAGRKLGDQQVDTLLETLRLTPSSFGLQPWHFVVVQDETIRNSLLMSCYGQRQVVDASHLFVLCRPTRLDWEWAEKHLCAVAETRGVPPEKLECFADILKRFIQSKTETELMGWMDNQVFIALGNLLTACAMDRIDACPIGGFNAEELSRILGLGDRGLWPVVICPIGYRSELDRHRENKKVRFPMAQVVTRI